MLLICLGVLFIQNDYLFYGLLLITCLLMRLFYATCPQQAEKKKVFMCSRDDPFKLKSQRSQTFRVFKLNDFF